MLHKLPRHAILVALFSPFITACSSTPPSLQIPAEFSKSGADIPEVISFWGAEPQIHIEAIVLMVPTKLLNSTTVIKSQPVDASDASVVKYITLDPQTASSFLAAIQAGNNTLAAPQFNVAGGQTAKLAITKMRNYVKGFSLKDPPAGTANAPGVELDVETLTTGIWLELAATFDPDQRSFHTFIHPTLISLDGIDTFTAGAPTGAFIQLPKTTRTDFIAASDIPQGKTLLVIGRERIDDRSVLVILRPALVASTTVSAKSQPKQWAGGE